MAPVASPDRPITTRTIGVFLLPLLVAAACISIVVAPSAALAASVPPNKPFDDAYVADGTVSAVARSGSTTYIGGDFTRVGPYMGGGVPIDASSGLAVSTFPEVDGQVFASVADGIGGEFIGGSFTNVGGVSRNNMAHIQADGTVDGSFNPDANGAVRTIAISGSTIYVGGDFMQIQGTSGGPYTRLFLAALDSTGNPTSWNPGPNSAVCALAISGSGSAAIIYAAGFFSAMTFGPIYRNHLAAFDVNANLQSWNPNANGNMFALAVSGSTVYAGGSFSGFQNGAYARNNIAAISATTGNPTAWNPNADYPVYALAVSGSTVYAGGWFSTLQGASGGPYVRQCLAAINSSTGNPTTWNPYANSRVRTIAVSGSTVYAGGDFDSLQGNSGGPYARKYIAAIDATSGIPTAWDPHAYGPVSAIAVSGANVYAGGAVSSLGGLSRNHLAALDETGQATAWNPNANGSVAALAASGSTVYVGGAFTTIQGMSGGPYARKYIAALDASSGNPTPWDPDADQPVTALAVSGPTVYAGGGFTGFKGGTYPRTRLAAIDAGTGIPTAWSPGADNGVGALVVSGSTVYIGGFFQNITGTTSGSHARKFAAAVDSSSGNPTSWDPEPDSGVKAIAVSGTSVFLGGYFTHLNTTAARNYLGAVDATSGNVTSWDPHPDSPVNALCVSGTTVFAGGYFATLQGSSGGPFTRNGAAGIDTATANATDWNPDAEYSVACMSVSGPTICIGGDFAVVGGGARARFAMFQAAPFVSSLSPTSASCGDTVTVNGSNFGTTRGSSYVSFGSKKATSYTSWTNTQIKVKVPSGCYWTKDIKVTTVAGTSGAKTLKIKPHISAISPTSGSVGAYITVGGTGFGSSKSTSSVKFGTKLAYTSSTSWTNVKVKAKVPTLSKGKTTITVTTRGGTSNSYSFTVK